MTTEHQRRGALEALDRILNRGGDADDVLREVIGTVGPLYDAVAIAVGPAHGTRTADDAVATFPISFDGSRVGELQVATPDDDDRAFLERVALLVSPYCPAGSGGVLRKPQRAASSL